MNCKNCGGFIPEGAAICAFCGKEVDNYEQVMAENRVRFGMPQCPKCGHIGNGVPEKMLEKKDWFIIILTFFSGIGLIYLLYIYMKRGDVNKRNTICPVCGTVMANAKLDESKQDLSLDINKAKNIATAVLKNPEIRKNFKDIKNSAKAFQNSMDINKY